MLKLITYNLLFITYNLFVTSYKHKEAAKRLRISTMADKHEVGFTILVIMFLFYY